MFTSYWYQRSKWCITLGCLGFEPRLRVAGSGRQSGGGLHYRAFALKVYKPFLFLKRRCVRQFFSHTYKLSTCSKNWHAGPSFLLPLHLPPRILSPLSTSPPFHPNRRAADTRPDGNGHSGRLSGCRCRRVYA